MCAKREEMLRRQRIGQLKEEISKPQTSIAISVTNLQAASQNGLLWVRKLNKALVRLLAFALAASILGPTGIDRAQTGPSSTPITISSSTATGIALASAAT